MSSVIPDRKESVPFPAETLLEDKLLASSRLIIPDLINLSIPQIWSRGDEKNEVNGEESWSVELSSDVVERSVTWLRGPLFYLPYSEIQG